jgi:hypothetical protein
MSREQPSITAPSGAYVVSGDADGRVFVWDWKSCKIYKKFQAHEKVLLFWHLHDISFFSSWRISGLHGCWVAPSGEQQVSVCWCVAWRHILHLTTRLTHHRLGRSHQILGLMVIHAFDSHTSVIVQRKSLFCSVNAIIVFLSNKSVNDLIPVVQSSSGSIKTNFVP